MDAVEFQIAEWRAYVAKAPAVDGRDADELEAHLRDQIAELDAAGLKADEAFLVAVKRMGDLDTLSREFAREHRGRLWKQLVLRGEDEPARQSSGWLEALVFAVAAGVVAQVVRLAAEASDGEPWWLLRNASLFVLPFLAGYFARRRQLDLRAWALTAAPFVVAGLVVNLYPYRAGSGTIWVPEPARYGYRFTTRPATTKGAAVSAQARRSSCRRRAKYPARNGSTNRLAFRSSHQGSPSEASAARRTTWATTPAATANTSASSQPLDCRAGSSSPLRTSCFHSRPLCSRANSRDRVSRSPIRFTATRKASSPLRPAASSSAIWSRRWASSSSASRPSTAGAFAT